MCHIPFNPIFILFPDSTFEETAPSLAFGSLDVDWGWRHIPISLCLRWGGPIGTQLGAEVRAGKTEMRHKGCLCRSQNASWDSPGPSPRPFKQGVSTMWGSREEAFAGPESQKRPGPSPRTPAPTGTESGLQHADPLQQTVSSAILPIHLKHKLHGFLRGVSRSLSQTMLLFDACVSSQIIPNL